jgi:hypothetical protein
MFTLQTRPDSEEVTVNTKEENSLDFVSQLRSRIWPLLSRVAITQLNVFAIGCLSP